MNSRLLIDAIVQQTTVLIAQLSTAAGIRAPLAHIADQVFLELSREIERQGVSRKVAADMFGLALRGYQKRVQRVSESVSVRDQTLWQAIYDYVCDEERVTRARVLKRFAKDAPEHVAAVLNDLVSSGLIFAAGRGRNALYRVVSASDRRAADAEEGSEGLASLVLLAVYRRRARSLAELPAVINAPEPALRAAVEELIAEGRLARDGQGDDAELRAGTVQIAVGAEHGWEAAVFDHFRAVATAIGNKVQRGARSQHGGVGGGATLSFDVYEGHPHRDEVNGLLARVRADVNALWNKVVAFNDAHPVAEDGTTKVTFYFGQNVERLDQEKDAGEVRE